MSHGRDEDSPNCLHCNHMKSHFKWCLVLVVEDLREKLREAEAKIDRLETAMREEGVRLGE